MIGWIAILLIAGLILSAFFSGNETGFYRVTRVRLVFDARSGNLISLALLWLANHTSVIVATVLIGNNLANYLISLSLVLLCNRLFEPTSQMQSLMPLMATPLIFVYAELFPKLLFYQAPYKLLRACAPFMIVFSILFLPISILVFAYEAVWSFFTGQSQDRLGYSLGKQEIQQTLREGQEAGVVIPMQRELAENIFIVGSRPIRQFTVPLRAIPLVDVNSSRTQALAAASRYNSPLIGVTQNNRLSACCLAAEVNLDLENPLLPLLPLCTAQSSEACIQVLTRMQASHAPMVYVTDNNGQSLGIVTRERLTSLLIAS
jgi:putative hemolysin